MLTLDARVITISSDIPHRTNKWVNIWVLRFAGRSRAATWQTLWESSVQALEISEENRSMALG